MIQMRSKTNSIAASNIASNRGSPPKAPHALASKFHRSSASLRSKSGVGLGLGRSVGNRVGAGVGCLLGLLIGKGVGNCDGSGIGCVVGRLLGINVGTPVGTAVGAGCAITRWQIAASSSRRHRQIRDIAQRAKVFNSQWLIHDSPSSHRATDPDRSVPTSWESFSRL